MSCMLDNLRPYGRISVAPLASFSKKKLCEKLFCLGKRKKNIEWTMMLHEHKINNTVSVIHWGLSSFHGNLIPRNDKDKQK